MNWIKLFLLLGLSTSLVYCDSQLDGDNVCVQTRTVKKEKSVDEPIKYEIKYQGMCGILPCTKTRTEVRMDSKIKTTFEDETFTTCCPGYAEAPNKKCAPICLNSCNNGKCVLPGVCKCNVEPTLSSPGFAGSTCNRFICLAVDRWGSNCDKECNCPANSYCSASSGKCLCHSGWQGANCTEECDSKTGCGDVELPPIIDPDVNIIPGSYGHSQKLEDLSPKALERELDAETEQQIKSATSLVVLHMEINLLLILLTFSLIGLVLWYRNRLSRLYHEIYATSTGRSSSDNSSNYSPESFYSLRTNSTIQNRPRMPTPHEADYLSKNLSFASATRNILLKEAPSSNKLNEDREKIISNPLIEKHLISSHKNSKKNLYSDISSNIISDKSCNIETQTTDSTILSLIPEEKMINLSSSSDEHEYQVPRYSANSSINIDLPTTLRQVQLDGQQHDYDHYENDQSNIYEEIKPRSPTKHS